jgi:hypothetical protein
LSRLYDSKFDNEIAEDIFKEKEQEYNCQIVKLDSQIQDLQAKNRNSYDNLIKTLELSKSIYHQDLRANLEEKAKILKLVASN